MNEKTLLITGVSKGIGKAISLEALSQGYNVVGLSRSASNIQHEKFREFQVDITNYNELRKVFNKIDSEEISISVLINNAGIASMNHFLLMSAITAENIFKTNFFGVFNLCHFGIRNMMKNRNGKILNISTVAVSLGLEGEAVYAASKAAVETLTNILSKEVSTFGISVRSLRLPPIQTDLIKHIDSKKIKSINSQLGINRVITVPEAASFIFEYATSNIHSPNSEIETYLGN
jgi:3-oxoacyl-[acyl-carrier protein] reductase